MTGDGSFGLATVSRDRAPPFVALVLGDHAVRIDSIDRHVPNATASSTHLSCSSLLDLLQQWDHSFDRLRGLAAFVAREGLDNPQWQADVAPLAKLKVHAPIPRPPGMFFAAVNYPRPAREKKHTDPAVRRPYMFEKSSRCAIGPYDDIVKPVGFDKIDWEVELAFILGRGGSRIGTARAMDHVAGFLIANDITCRGFRQPGELPIQGPDWFGSKCHSTFAPLGPVFVPRAFVSDCRNLRLTLTVNGEVRQDGNSRDMLFSPEEMLAHVSNQLTLEPGDLFSTGTPEGFGAQSERFLQPGDIIEAAIEGLGAQRNRLVTTPAA